MKLIGHKIIATSALLLSVSMANSAPSLVEFSAGTAAKAAEVNANFESLKTYSAGLETVTDAQTALITALENKATTAEAERVALKSGADAQTALITALENKATTAEAERVALESATNAQTALITALENKATTAEAERIALENNISTLETESTRLQNQISALGGGDAYTIAVFGDGDLIGHTNTPKVSNDKQYLPLKTEYGMVVLKPGNDNYEMREYDHLDQEQGYHSVYYIDNSCNNPVSVLNANPIGFSMLFTESKGVTDTAFIATSSDAVFFAEAGTVFLDTPIDVFYYKSNDDCLSANDYAGKTYIPVVELDDLKSSYTSVRLEGFQTN